MKPETLTKVRVKRPQKTAVMKAETLRHIINECGHTNRSFGAFMQKDRDTIGDYVNGVRPIPMWLALAATCLYRRLEPLE